MPSLILLNGPPGIGKSTLSTLYAERHAGALNLDIDTLHRLVGGWQNVEQDTHQLLRPIALAMAATHLAGRHDVVLPQYLASAEEIEAFERVAVEQDAAFREVVLLDEKSASIERFDSRTDDTAWDRHNRNVVELQGGATMLTGMYDALLKLLKHRPTAMIIRSEPEAVEATYTSLMRALEE